MHVILVIPCYNEERRLPVDALRGFQPDDVRVQFCLVNDGSGDGTLRLIESLHRSDPERFLMLDLDRNRGKAEAVRRGIEHAAGLSPQFVGFWDADLATPLDQLPFFFRVFRERPEIEMVFAARVRLLGREISRRPARHYIGRVGATLISSSLGLAVYDTQCGAKIFRMTPAMRDVFREPFISRWIFDVEIIARYIRAHGRDAAARAIYELPIMKWHDVPGSKIGPLDFVHALGDLWKIHRAYKKR